MSAGSTTDGLSERSPSAARAQRRLYVVVTAALSVIIGLAVTDGLRVTSAYGVRTSHRTASAEGYVLVVDYASVTRPGIASPFTIEVRSPGGFDGPVTLGVDRAYLRMWDENGLSPAPSGERVRGAWIDWTFDAPDGDVLTVTLDARVEPGVQAGRDGAVQLTVGGRTIAEASFRTRVMP